MLASFPGFADRSPVSGPAKSLAGANGSSTGRSINPGISLADFASASKMRVSGFSDSARGGAVWSPFGGSDGARPATAIRRGDAADFRGPLAVSPGRSSLIETSLEGLLPSVSGDSADSETARPVPAALAAGTDDGRRANSLAPAARWQAKRIGGRSALETQVP